MSKKKDKSQKEIGAANMLRFYDTELIGRLNRLFNESGNRYENRNHFLTDLIETGLTRREHEISFRDKLWVNEAETHKSIDAFAERFMEFEKYVRTQFQSIGASDFMIKAILTETRNLTEAVCLRKTVSPDSIKSGAFEHLPERFKKLKETAERIFVKDE
jgi:hypothetical protein